MSCGQPLPRQDLACWICGRDWPNVRHRTKNRRGRTRLVTNCSGCKSTIASVPPLPVYAESAAAVAGLVPGVLRN